MTPWDGSIAPDAFGAGFALAFMVAGSIWAFVAGARVLRRLLSE
jgi:hypothetical protein